MADAAGVAAAAGGARKKINGHELTVDSITDLFDNLMEGNDDVAEGEGLKKRWHRVSVHYRDMCFQADNLGKGFAIAVPAEWKDMPKAWKDKHASRAWHTVMQKTKSLKKDFDGWLGDYPNPAHKGLAKYVTQEKLRLDDSIIEGIM